MNPWASAPVARFDAYGDEGAEPIIPREQIPGIEKPTGDPTKDAYLAGACHCACGTKRVDGKLASTGSCECQRFVGIRDTEHGPRPVHEPCSPGKEPTMANTKMHHHDAIDRSARLMMVTTAAHELRMQRMHLHTDAPEPRARSRMSGTFGTAALATRSIPIVASTPKPAGDQPAITEWDLSAWEKNPAILWGHDHEGVNLPIGFGQDASFGPEGLKMIAVLASERANPLAEQVLQCAVEGVVRAVSVGYELVGPGKAKLLEVSFVPIGLDEDAGTPALNPAAASGGEGHTRYFSSLDNEQPEEKDPDWVEKEREERKQREAARTDSIDSIERARAARDKTMHEIGRTTPTATMPTHTERADAGEDDPRRRRDEAMANLHTNNPWTTR